MSDQHLQHYIKTFGALRENPEVKGSDLRNWFSQNINSCCQAICGRTGRALDQGSMGGTYSVQIKESNNTLLAILDITCCYEKQTGAIGERPPVEVLKGLLPEVKMLRTRKQLPNALRVQLTLDLKVWGKYAASLLGTYLYQSWVDPHRDMSYVHKDESAAELVLKHVYPNVDLNFLRIAADLGVVGRDPAMFTSWFHQYLQGLDCEPVKLSEDFENQVFTVD